MSAKLIQEGYKTVGFNSAGQLEEVDLAVVHAEVPGDNGEWCFVVQGNDFCWIKGLGPGEGYQLYRLPLTGPQSSWQQQIEAFCEQGPDETGEISIIAAGTKTALAQKNVFIIAE